MSERDEIVAWAAGLFEGEGSFSQSRRRYGRGRYPRAALAMTDEDVVRRFHQIVGVGNVNGPYDHGIKPRWRWETSRLEHVQTFVRMVWPWLGERRRARALEILKEEEQHLTPLGRAISRGKIAAAEARKLACD